MVNNAGLEVWFEGYVSKKPVFKNYNVLSDTFIPDVVHFRETEIKEILKTLSPILRGGRGSNLFIFGRPGSGKTASILHTKNTLETVSKKNNIPVRILYTNCSLKKESDTEYRMLVNLNEQIGNKAPKRGLSISELYERLVNTIKTKKQYIILILDEIDIILRNDNDSFLYTFSRINPELNESRLSVIGITNKLSLLDALEARTRSSLSPQEMVFAPYNATQLKEILGDRAKSAFYDGAVSQHIVSKCAALAAQEHGDARRAIELLRVSGEIAEKEGKLKITETEIEKAIEKITFDNVINMVYSQPKQVLCVLYSILKMFSNGKKMFQTGDVYEVYLEVAKQNSYRVLGQNAISGIITELDNMGVIRAKSVYKGAYGNTREITGALSKKIEGILMQKLDNEITINTTLTKFGG